MRVLGISGSLRRASINSAMLRVTKQLAPPEIELRIYARCGDLPLFNPDLDPTRQPAVMSLFAEVEAADALIIASPEYAHGVTGVVKNCLDWLVGFERFADKPVALPNNSPRAHHADAALRETLKTMSALIVESASPTIPLLGQALTEADMLASPIVCARIRDMLRALHSEVMLKQRDQGPSFL